VWRQHDRRTGSVQESTVGVTVRPHGRGRAHTVPHTKGLADEDASRMESLEEGLPEPEVQAADEVREDKATRSKRFRALFAGPSGSPP
jgi:hypothetical protein